MWHEAIFEVNIIKHTPYEMHDLVQVRDSCPLAYMVYFWYIFPSRRRSFSDKGMYRVTNYRECMNDFSVVDLGFFWPKCTWTHNQFLLKLIQLRFDRA